jgi:hypothetical protein
LLRDGTDAQNYFWVLNIMDLLWTYGVADAFLPN